MVKLTEKTTLKINTRKRKTVTRSNMFWDCIRETKKVGDTYFTKSNGKTLPNLEYVHRLEPGLLSYYLFLLMPPLLTISFLLKKYSEEGNKDNIWQDDPLIVCIFYKLIWGSLGSLRKYNHLPLPSFLCLGLFLLYFL